VVITVTLKLVNDGGDFRQQRACYTCSVLRIGWFVENFLA
jgi:hypothetical protein